MFNKLILKLQHENLVSTYNDKNMDSNSTIPFYDSKFFGIAYDPNCELLLNTKNGYGEYCGSTIVCGVPIFVVFRG